MCGGRDGAGTKEHTHEAGHGERDSAKVMHWVRRTRYYGRAGVEVDIQVRHNRLNGDKESWMAR